MCTFLTCAAYFPGIMMPQFLVLASICCICRWASLLKAKYNKLRDHYDTTTIKSTLLRKPLHYLIWRGNMDLCWSWWRVEDKYHYEFHLLCYALLLNLAFRIWIYSARISEVWKHNVDKESDLFVLMPSFYYGCSQA